MGSKISLVNDTNQDWECYFTLIGGGRPAGGKKLTVLKGNSWKSITGEYTLALPIMVCI